MSITIREVAERAGVSIATVSRVINESGKVRQSTRDRVLAVIHDSEYATKYTAKIQENYSSSLIGVIVPNLYNSFYREIIQGISAEAAKYGFNPIILDSQEDDTNEMKSLRILRHMPVAGVIIAPASDDEDCINNEYLNLLSSIHIPIVLVDRDVKHSNFDGVFVDNARGAYEATRILLEAGHEKVALLAGPVSSKPGRDRLKGYCDAYTTVGKMVEESLIYYGKFRLLSGYELAKKALKEHPDVTAFFACSNLLASGCIQAMLEAGKKIPGDITVFASEELRYADVFGYRIPHVGGVSRALGATAMEMLKKKIDAGLASKRTHMAQPVNRVTLVPHIFPNG